MKIQTIYNKIILKKWLWFFTLTPIILIVGVLVFSLPIQSKVLAEVETSTIVRSVSVSGEAKSSSFVDLAFEQTGSVSNVGVKVGDNVSVGKMLVTLDQAKARADLLSAQSNLDYQLGLLAEAQISLVDSERLLEDSLRESYTTADDTVRNYVNNFFKNPDSLSASFQINFNDGNRNVNFEIQDFDLETSLNTKKREIDKTLNQWKLDLRDFNLSNNSNQLIEKTQSNLESVRLLLDDLSLAVNSLNTDYFEYRSTIEGYKSNVSNARTNINTAINKLTSARSQWNTAKLNAAVSSGGLVSTQSAQIKQAEAQVAEKKALLSKLSLVAPISGVVTKQEAKVGESVSAGEVLVSILNPDSFEVEANIPEINIGKIKVGQKSTITLDAFPGENFSGEVFYIDPAETLIDGVVNYKIKVSFTEKDERLKNGLTANLSITTDSKDQVVAVPVYAITTDKGVSTVKKYINGQVVVTPVKLGIYGDNGLVEVIEGLVAGDKIEVKAQ